MTLQKPVIVSQTYYDRQCKLRHSMSYTFGINTYLVPKLFRKVQFGTRTLGMFNLVPQFSKEIQFGPLR